MSVKIISNAYALEGQFSHLAKSSNRFVIAGYASFNIVDSQNDLVNLEALGAAFAKMMAVPERRNFMYHHSNIQIGKILPEYMDPEGNIWISGIDDYGLFIIAELFTDIKRSVDVINDMMKGKYLAFSIGGQVLKRVQNCDDDKCWSEIIDMDLHEVTSCERGANISARGVIFEKSAESFTDIAISASKNDTFITNNVNNSSEGIFVPEIIVEKTDLQLVLDAVSELKSVVDQIRPIEKEAVVVDIPSEDTITLDAIAAIVDERINKLRDELTPVEPEVVEKEVIVETIVEKMIYVYDEPIETAFENKEEFEESLVKYQALVDKITEEMGESITKSKDIIDTHDDKPAGIDFKALYKKAWEATDLDDLLKKVGVN